MLHKAPQAGNYQQAEQLANDLGGGGRLHVQRFPGATQASQTSRLATQQPLEEPRTHVQPILQSLFQSQRTEQKQGGTSQSWDEQTTWPEEAEPSSFMNGYSTPLDLTSIPMEKRKLAEQIAK